MVFKIKRKTKCNDSIVRTIRFSGTNYDMLEKLAIENDITFNNVVNQVIEYCLENEFEK